MLPARVIALALAASLAPAAQAADSTVQVAFERGKQSREFRSSITGDAGVNYLLPVLEGQVMQVLFAAQKGSCYFNVFEPGSPDAAVHIGSSAGNEFGASPTKAGTYRIQVYQMRATARRNETCSYSISFEVTGEGRRGTAPAAAAPSEVAKGACLFKFGADARVVQTSALKPGYWELVLQADGSSRKAACTVSDGGDVADWVEMKK